MGPCSIESNSTCVIIKSKYFTLELFFNIAFLQPTNVPPLLHKSSTITTLLYILLQSFN